MRLDSRFQTTVALFISALIAGTNGAFADSSYPVAKTVPVTDSFFGKTVADPYRWLENGSDPEVKSWAAAQTARALAAIHGAPSYGAYKARIAELSRTSTSRFGLSIRGGRYFYGRETPPQEQWELVVRDGLRGTERVLFDPKTAAAADGTQPAIETFAVAQDGSKVAFTTQFGGSEDETLHVVDATTGAMLPDTIPHAGGGTSPVAVTWDADGKGFLHTLWPKNSDGTYATAGILLYHHVLGTDPSTDTYVFGKGLSPKNEYALATSRDGRAREITAADGDGVHASIYLQSGNGPFELVAGPSAGIGDSDDRGGQFVGDSFYAIATGRHPAGEIVALEPGGSFDTAKTVVPSAAVSLNYVVPVAGGFVLGYVDGGDGGARLFATDGTLRGSLPVPPISTLTTVAGDPDGGPVIFGYSNYTTPSRWIAFDPATGTATETGIAETSPGDFSNIVTKRVLVPSADGHVQIPLEFTYAKSTKLDGTAPTFVYAYGAYGIVTSPYFDSTALAWLERGGISAVAMVRGGGEYGDAWHLAARHETKTLSSDDLASCAKWLETNGYSSARHLGIIGGSAGGFLMGLAITRNPEVYRAVDAEVGIFDLLRFQLTPNGAYNVGEFGTTKDPAQFAFMLAQSPYHNVHKGTAYPAVLMTTGENDPRVEPYNSRKMTATLQADTSSSNPIYLIQRAGQGHGIGNSFDQSITERTETFAFFDTELR